MRLLLTLFPRRMYRIVMSHFPFHPLLHPLITTNDILIGVDIIERRQKRIDSCGTLAMLFVPSPTKLSAPHRFLSL